MPNHVKNIVTFQCDEDKRREILEKIKDDALGIGSIDFNKIIPRPESLDMAAGSEETRCIRLYLTAVDPAAGDFGREKAVI
ncbi:hypothetical protein FACS1894191_6640 [Clostridia bacterium]|nr:hypothetical protein FACS1894191_6640 [Clostridia bacterium]